MSDSVTIHYHRPPDRLELFHQRVVARTDEYVVTYLDAAPLRKPSIVADAPILEPGSPIVWFTYPGRWYDVGRFHLADGTFTGYYANILTPVQMTGERWETTDLFLDVWVDREGKVTILDEAEFAEATESRWLAPATATTARETAETLAAAARQGAWPHQEVREWTLEKVRELRG